MAHIEQVFWAAVVQTRQVPWQGEHVVVARKNFCRQLLQLEMAAPVQVRQAGLQFVQAPALEYCPVGQKLVCTISTQPLTAEN